MTMNQIKFSHWFWITAWTLGLLLIQTANGIKTEEISQEQNLVRRGHSFISFKTNKEENNINEIYLPSETGAESDISTSTSKSVSISQVRVEVGENHHHPGRKFKKKIKKKVKHRKTFLEKIYAKIKEFARVTLATRKVTNDKEIAPKFTQNSFGHNNSENISQAGPGEIPEDQLNIANDRVLVPEVTPDHSVDNDSDIDNDEDRKWSDKHQPNVMSFDEFSPLAHVNTDDAAIVNNDNLDDIEKVNINKILEDTTNVITEDETRHEHARGRSLWHVTISEREKDRARQGKVMESSSSNEANDHRGLEARFSSFTGESAVIFESDGAGGGIGSGILAWSNIIIVTVSIAASFAFLTVVVAAVIYRRSKTRNIDATNCDQFSDIASTSSRSSASTTSTISSTRSSKSNVPDKLDIISFNAEGTLRKQAYNCDDLYSLDSDYFLSSLEDISVQI